jgi:hypothetical protein
VDWVKVAHRKIQQQNLVNKLRNLYEAGNFLTKSATISFSCMLLHVFKLAEKIASEKRKQLGTQFAIFLIHTTCRPQCRQKG